MQPPSKEEQRAQRRRPHDDIPRKEEVSKKERRTSNAMASTRSEIRDGAHARHGRELQGQKEEAARRRAEAEKRREAQEEIARREGEASAREKRAWKRSTGLKKRTEEVDSHEANMTVERVVSFSRIPPRELGKRLEEVQDDPIEETRRSLGVACAVGEEGTEGAQSRLERLAPR